MLAAILQPAKALCFVFGRINQHERIPHFVSDYTALFRRAAASIAPSRPSTLAQRQQARIAQMRAQILLGNGLQGRRRNAQSLQTRHA
jgi:hypothetical protein